VPLKLSIAPGADSPHNDMGGGIEQAQTDED
jgi:hypothetical protein